MSFVTRLDAIEGSQLLRACRKHLRAIAFGTGNLPRDATASHNETNDTMNVLQLEQTGDAKALPRQEISDEVSIGSAMLTRS